MSSLFREWKKKVKKSKKKKKKKHQGDPFFLTQHWNLTTIVTFVFQRIKWGCCAAFPSPRGVLSGRGERAWAWVWVSPAL